jgi:hypothetical protein
MSDAHFHTALRCRLGLAILPRGTPNITCFCRTALSAAGSEHAHTCPVSSGLHVMRHDNFLEVVHHAMRRACIHKKPFLPNLQRSDTPAAACPSACRDSLFVLKGELRVSDVSIIHPAAPNTAASPLLPQVQPQLTWRIQERPVPCRGRSRLPL